MKNNLFKKSMSVFLSVLMLMSCWVWVAPVEAEAAGETAAINTGVLNQLNTTVDTNMSYAYGKFLVAGNGDNGGSYTTARAQQSYVNVLYSPYVYNANSGGTPAATFGTVTNADRVAVWYPTTVLMYDGSTQARMGVLLEVDSSSAGALRCISCWMDSGTDGLTFDGTYQAGKNKGTENHWKGYTDNGDSAHAYIMYDDGDKYYASANGTEHSSYKFNVAKGDWGFLGGHLKFTGSLNANEWVRAIKPTWKFWGGKDGSTKTYDGTTNNTIYVMNIKGYRDLVSQIASKKSELINNAGAYTPASVKAFVDAANVITTTLAPKNYVSTSSHNVTSWNTQMIGAYNTYTAAVNGLTKRTFDIGYENLFSISDWYNSNSAIAINGEVTADPAAGTVTLKNTGSSEAFTNYNSSKNVSHSYTFPVVAGEKYTAEYKTTSADSGTELFMFFYDSSDNLLVHDNMATGGTRCVKNDFTAPSGAVKAEIRFDVNDSGKTITFKDIAIYKTSRENAYQISSWSANPYTKGVTYNSTIGTLGTPSRNGYNSFDGWYYDEAYTQPVNSTDTLTASKTVYAKWSNPIEYTITYNADGGNITSANYTTTYIIDDEFILPSAERAGHTFKGWKITNGTDRFAQSDLNGQVLGAKNYGKGLYGNATMVAQWEANTYTVTFIDAENNASTQEVAYGKTPTAPANTATVSNGASGHTVYTWPAIGAVTGNETYKEIATTSGHNFGDWITETASTCTSEGAKYRTCNTCGYRENSTIEKASHTLVHVAAVAPTCTVDGNIEYWYCSACSKKFSDENGTNEITDVTDAKKGHTEVTIPAVESTCTNTGLTEGKKCSVCGTITVAQQTTDKKAHSMGAWSQTTAPTCDTAGQETRKCANCSYTETNEIPATGNHILSDYIIDKDATCVTPGSKHKECTACDYETEEEAIPATGVHVYGDWAQFNDGTTHRRYCTLDTLNCQAYEEGTHVFTGATRQMDSGNYHQYKCDKCEAYGVGTQMNIGEACFGEGTTYENTDANSHKVTCKCGREKTEGHALEKVDGTYVAPTCLVDGAQGWKCTKCDYTYTETLTATGHTPAAAVTENTVDSSCYAEGSYDEVVYCAVESCKTELSRTPKTIEKKEHTPAAAVREDIKKANCTNEGSYNEVVYCSVCKAAGRTTKISTESKTIAPRGHDMGDWYYASEADKPTYTKTGTETSDCKNTTPTELYEACNHKVTREVPMLVDTTAPTGTITYKETVWDKFLETITFGIYTSEDVNLTIAAEDAESGVAKIEYYISDTALTKAEVTALNDWTAYDSGVTISKVDAAKKVVYAKLTNTQNCVSYISTDGFTFDLTAPVITSDITCTTATITVNEANIDKVIVNDEEVALTDGKYTITGKGTHTVKAIDKAGNATEEITVEIKGHTEGEAVTEKEVEPTCTTAGSYDEVVYCTVETCKAEISRKTVTIEPIGHSYSAEVTARPTQNADGTWTKGVYTYTCSRCGDSYTEEASRADYSELENIVEELNNLLTNEKLTDEGKSAINKALAKEEAFADNLVEIEQKQINDLVEELKKTKATAENIIANAGMPQPITEAISGLKVQFLEADDIHTIESLQLNAGGGFDAARLRLTNNNATLPITVKSVIADKAYIGSSKSASSAEYKTATVINKDGSKDFYIVAPSGFNQTGLITYTITYNIGSSTEGYLKDKDGNAVVFETKAYIYVKGAAVTPTHIVDEDCTNGSATAEWNYTLVSNVGDFEVVHENKAPLADFGNSNLKRQKEFGITVYNTYDYENTACVAEADANKGSVHKGDAHAATYRFYIDTSLASTWDNAGFKAQLTETDKSVYDNATFKQIRLATNDKYNGSFSVIIVPGGSSNVPTKTWTATSSGNLTVVQYDNPYQDDFLFGKHLANYENYVSEINFYGTIPTDTTEAKLMFSPRYEYNKAAEGLLSGKQAEATTMTTHLYITSYDKGALRAAVNEAESGAYNRNYFTSASWSTYETALAAAKEVLGKAETTQGAVNDAATALTNAIKGLAREEYVLTLTHESYEGGLDAEKTATKIEYFLLFKDSTFTPALDSAFKANAKLNKHDEAVKLTIDGTKEQTYKYWHEHVYDAWYTTSNPTCTEPGSKRQDCNLCDHFVTEVIPATNHADKVHHEKVDATCVATGTIEYWSCAACGKNFSDEACTTVVENLTIKIDPDNHDLETVPAKDPTCTDIGWDEYVVCQREGCKYSTYNEKSALTHDWSDWKTVTSATCEAPGEEKRTCQRKNCGAYETNVLTQLSHSYTGEIKSDGNGKDATHSFKCVNGCNEYGAATKHSWNDGEVTTPATCIKEGVKTYTCTAGDCGATYTEEIDTDKTNHVGETYTKDEDIVLGTCESEKTWNEVTYCSDCDAKLGTVAKTGEKDANNHVKLVKDEAVAATCYATGLTEGQHCEVCGVVTVEQKVTNKIAHTPGETVIEKVTKPTCTADGSHDEVVYCSVCKAVGITQELSRETKVDTKLGHDEIAHEGKAATCEEGGYKAYVTCSRCDYTTYEAIKALGHKDENKDHKCDNGCNVYQGEHVDGNKDHACDYGCAEKIGTHADSAEDKDHVCDYGCGAVLEECVDNDKDHKCDNGCEVYFGEHKDTDKDHACDYGCKETIGTCEDKDKDHDCDYGCDKVYGDHVDGNKDHACDYGCAETIGEHKDSADDSDHICDYCKSDEILEACTASDWIVDVKPTCEGKGSQYKKCTVCGKVLNREDIASTGHDYDRTKSETNLTRPVQNADGTWTQGYYTYTCKNDSNHKDIEYVDRAGYTAYESALENLKELLGTDLTDAAKDAIKKAIKDNEVDDNLIASEQETVDEATQNLIKAFEDNNASLKTYTVTFKIEGSEDVVVTVVSGKDATAPQNPAKAYDETNHYDFDKWDKAFTNITSDTVVTAVFKAVAHTYTHTDKDDTHHTDSCACGYSKEVEHDYITSAVTKKATCDANGERTYTCEACRGTKVVAIEKRAHVYRDTEVQKKATCLAEGVMGTICTNVETDEYAACTHTSTKPIAKLSHSYTGEYKWDNSTTPKTHSQMCVNGCNGYGNETDCTFNEVVTAPTCFTGGYTTYTCTVCKNSYTADSTAMRTHDYEYSAGDGTSHTATCQYGDCDYTKTENCSGGIAYCNARAICEKCNTAWGSLNGNNHASTETHVDGYVAPTCTTPGATGDTKYDCCNAVKVASTVISVDADAHTGTASVTKNAKAATCTSEGYTGDIHWSCCDALETKGEAIKALGHKDENKDHKCDNGCNVYQGEHVDGNKDHACDYGCAEKIGTCEDKDFDHDCDYGCEVYFGEHKDADTDHVCDYGCKETIGTCEDEDKDHDCDYGCDKVYGTCEDKDKDHDCDYGCDKYFGTHADSAEDKDHVCDYGCGAVLEECVDNDKDHKCDNGCDKVYGDHIDSNKDHACDYGCAEKLGEHKDSADDGDHICDYCKSDEILEGCTAGDWIVDVKPTCEGKGSQYKKCTVCGKVLDREDIPSTGHDYDRTKSETNLTRPVQNADGIWAQGYYTYTCKNDSNHKEKEYVDRAGYTAYESALENLKELLETDITDTAKEAIKKAIEDNKVADNLIASEQETVDNATSKLEETIERYKGSLKTYTVTFKIEGSEDVVVTVFSGNDATAPQNPAKAYDETNHYDFDKWDKEFTNITSDTVVTAVFKAVAHTYTHTDKDDTHHTDSCACGYSKDVEHDYTTSAVTKKATCDANGERTYTCEACGGTKVVAIEKRAHVYKDTTVQKKATCLAEGVMGTICTNGETDEYAACTHTSTRPIAKLSHSYTGEYKWNNSTTPKTHSQKCVNGCNEYGNTAECTFNEVVTAPTCFTGGYTTYTCTVCSNSYTAVSTAMRTHDYKYSAGDGTSHTATCQYDDCAYTETENCSGGTATCTDKAICEKCNTAWGSLNGNNHASTETYVDGYVAPTCTTPGATGDTKYDCCNAVKVASEEIPVKADAHTGTASVTKNAKAATCTSEGYTGDIHWSCCDALETKGSAIAIDKNAHTTNKTHIDGYVAPTCTTPGATGDTKYDCCNAVKVASEVIPATGHTFSATVEANAASCLAAGNKAYKQCTVCNLYFAADAAANAADGKKDTSSFVLTQLEHSYTGAIKSDGNGKDATHSFKCVNGCNEYGAAAQHSWNNGKVTTPATCLKEGVKTYTCTAGGCGATYTEVIPVDADAHTGAANVVKNKVDATCTAEGYTGDIHWSCCGALKTKGSAIAIDKDAHTTNKTHVDGYVAPTCTTPGATGDTKYDCCNAVKVASEEIPVKADAHTGTASVTKNAKAATCTAEGYTGDIHWSCCDALKTKGSAIAIDKNAHTTDKTHVDGYVAPTCTTPGATGDTKYSCCDAVKVASTVIPVDADAHTGAANVVKNKADATCTSEGYTGDIHWSCCGALETKGEVIEKLPHSEKTREENRKEATCGADGSYDLVTYCSVCNNVIKTEAQIIPATGKHIYATEVEGSRVDATCKKEGSVIFQCACGAAEKTILGINTDNHENIVTDKAVAPTCTSTGLTEGSHCEACGKVIVAQKIIDVLPHKDENKDGYCDVCGTDLQEICSHSETEVRGKLAATCVSEGYTGDTYCKLCFKKLETGSAEPRTEHRYGERPVNVIGATCTAERTEVFKCENCPATKNVVQEKDKEQFAPHVIIRVTKVEPTCDKNGIDIYYCTVCSTDVEIKKIEPTGHVDKDNDGVCDIFGCGGKINPPAEDSDRCTCLCHKDGWLWNIIYKIVRFFWKLFKISKACDCGFVHY